MSQSKWIETDTVHDHISTLEGVIPKDAWGETSYFYNPGRIFERGTYFATVKQKDGDNDKASHLDRDGIWRLNIGVTKGTYFERFGPPPPRPGKGGIVDGDWNYTALDTLTPHPVYGWMSWVAVLNPSKTTWQQCIALIEDAHGRAKINFEKRVEKLP
ncbi:DUF6194 family protein [Jannaschia sp. CCS1]|uniref:DUF6194 family protein n=1 Tax=Jannaschia sp. (strain CCS1) TaxID=290400 RepID=UPI000053C7EE|nr:DUF6194 family protein [Jannaschia sp. CCS1]ABD53794.1 hypothetical protein Jann_0877 [Jannaschia sp. CCS1]